MTGHAKFWNKKAEGYAKSKIADEETYQKKLAETQEYFNPEMHVLEFGCGTGTTAVHHAPHVAHITATDIAENMLEIGRQRAKEAGVENITFKCGALRELDSEAESYDAVLGLNILHLVDDRKVELDEVARILKPGGVFVSSTVCVSNSILRFMSLLIPIGKLFGLLPDFYVIDEKEFVQEIKDAGFKIESHWHHGKDGIAVFIIAKKS